jgi:hypothetical protein
MGVKIAAMVRSLRRERGQMLMVFALLIMPVSFVVGAVAVDASLWQSERRGAYKDADLAALAGAFELIDTPDADDAEDAALASAAVNDEAGNAGQDPMKVDVTVDSSCFNTSRLDAVSVNLEHDSRTLFSEIFGMDLAPEIGAHAKACVGALTRPVGVRPFILDIETSPCFTTGGEPNFGAECVMDFGAQGSAGGANRGVADLEVPSSPEQCSNVGGDGDLIDIIANGAPNAVCATQTGDSCSSPFVNCVVGQTGNVANKTIDGMRELLDPDLAACDDRYDSSPDGIDQFEEALELIGGGTAPPSPSNVYVPRVCNDAGDLSRRLITIFAVDEWLGSNNPMPIRYFVTMYVLGCQRSNGTLNPTCQGSNGPPGHAQVRGIIIKAFVSEGGDIGAPDEGGTLTIALTE